MCDAVCPQDPTVMYQLQKELAVQEQRFEDASMFQGQIWHEATHSQVRCGP